MGQYTLNESGLKRIAQRITNRLVNPWITIRPDPVIIMGNQKSGTSAIASLLADFGGLSKTIDIPPLWGTTGARIMRDELYFADIVRRNKRYFTAEVIKEPFMTFFSDQVIASFPEARFIMIIRDPRENIRSLLNSRGLPTDATNLDQNLLAKVKKKHPAILDTTIWGSADNGYISVLAKRWNKAIDNYLQHSDKMLLVHYEDFIADKYAFIRSVAHQVGITECADISAKLDIQYQPRGQINQPWLDVFGKKNLNTIERICGDKLQKLGYIRSDKQYNTH